MLLGKPLYSKKENGDVCWRKELKLDDPNQITVVITLLFRLPTIKTLTRFKQQI